MPPEPALVGCLVLSWLLVDDEWTNEEVPASQDMEVLAIEICKSR